MTIKTTIGIILALLALGVTFALFSMNRTTEKSGSNADAMKGGKEIPVTGENVEYFPGAQGYVVRPEAAGIYPGVVMIHENRGLRPEIREAAEALASEGYVVLAVDLYAGTVLENQEEARTFPGFDQETYTANMRAGVSYLRE